MIISIVNHKGGTGKTTTAVSLGSVLALEGFSVLLVDMDAQGNLSYSLGLSEAKNTLSQVLLGECEVHNAVYKMETLSVIPANASLADVEISIANAEERFHYVKDLISHVAGYDYIIFDCPPSLSLLTTNALCASEGVIIPMQMEVLAVKGLEMMLDTVSKIKSSLNPALEILGVLPVMGDVRKNLYNEIKEYIGENFPVRIFKHSIRSSVKAAEAPSFGRSVVTYAPHSSAAIDYFSFAQEVIHITQPVNQQ